MLTLQNGSTCAGVITGNGGLVVSGAGLTNSGSLAPGLGGVGLLALNGSFQRTAGGILAVDLNSEQLRAARCRPRLFRPCQALVTGLKQPGAASARRAGPTGRCLRAVASRTTGKVGELRRRQRQVVQQA